MMKKNEESKNHEAEDLGIVVKSKDVVFWEGVIERAKAQRTDLEGQRKINDLILENAEIKLKEASKKTI